MKYLLLFLICFSVQAKLEQKVSFAIEQKFSAFNKLTTKTKKIQIEQLFTKSFIKGYGGVDKLKKEHLAEILPEKGKELEMRQGYKNKDHFYIRYKPTNTNKHPGRWFVMIKGKDGKFRIDSFIGDMED